jgi:hypothetical protein
MEPMTPEERFTRIENSLNTVAEYQAMHAEAIARHDAEIDKHNAAIRDLIVVSRTLVDSQKETTVQIQALASEMRQSREAQREAQQATGEKLHILIETVDRIIRNQKT